ncbi:protein CFT1 [Zopfia rhizophila CBS 207.26]|uniref:Protein CFT1 n=1 Tax=Zopfia rhizophila CBS 207.26 TaxID=1314779 RepID=A0A6A6E4Z5_9PEZI|nr:protein CFT1 [Zopfia rhizophila CBS 207.26]
MQCYTELAPPTAVTHALHLSFLAPKANNLVVAKNSLLQILELKSTVTEVSSDGDENANNVSPILDTEAADVPLQRTEHTAKLVLVGEYPLAGTVTSLARIKALNTKSGAEALLIAFRDAKLSLVEWDPETFNLNTVSIHYYENPDLAGAPWSADLKDTHNFLTADPSSRCAALKFGAQNLAILPFRQRAYDLVEDDYDSDLDGPRAEKTKESSGQDAHQTPYAASFVLPLTKLDPALTHPVHLSFLYEFREPTFGIIASSRATAPSLLAERKDILTYTVFTLDVEERASITLLSVQGIPYDVSRVVPLPLPIGGALLLGDNEIIHVDQAGKTNGVAVNEFAKVCTAFPLVDQSDLALRLEGCTVELLSQETGDVLIILNKGELITLTFTLDGRTVSGMTLQRVAAEHGGHVLTCKASCATNLGRGKIFVGSEDGESVLLGWTSKVGQLSRKRSQPDIAAENEDLSLDEEDLDDLDDDLYNDTTNTVKKITTAAAEPSAPDSYTFRVHDILPSLAPIKDVAFHSPANEKEMEERKISTQTVPTGDILASTGRGRAGGVTILHRELDPVNLKQSTLPSARGLWAVHAKKQAPKGLITDVGQDTEGDMASDAEYDQYLVVCKAGANGNEDTVVYQINGTEIEETSKGDFEREEGSTMNVGVLAGGTKVVQVMRTEVRTYDSELNMDQIIPMEDEDTGAELRIINASFADPYLMILRDDSSVKVFKASGSGEVEEMECSGLSSTQWLSASLFKSSAISEGFAFLLTPEGGLHVFTMSDLENPSYVAEGLGFLPPLLTADYAPRRSTAKAALTEVLVADLGDTTSKSPHLIVRTSSDDLVIYKAFHYPTRSATEPWTKNLRWIKLSQQHLPKYAEETALDAENAGRESTLITLDNICGYSTVFQRGTSPSFIFKEASSAPKVIGLSCKAVKGLTRYHTAGCERGFAYIDVDDTLRISQLPSQTHYGHLGWAARKIAMCSEIHAVSYHPRGVYVMGMGEMTEFTLPEDTYHYEWAKEDTTFKPHVEQGIIKVMDAETWSIIDTHVLDPHEIVLCVKTLNLEISETTHERKPLVAVGTAIVRGEDLATKGCIRIFEVITVVPEPGRPETNKKLRLIVKDEVKGAVTAVSELGTQGFMIMAQGQKCMVRGLKEDGTLLPVAFMDMQCYVTTLKTLPNTGMLLMGDAFKGVWFTGYTEEPYKMMLFGRSRNRMEVMAADFLPFERQLHIIVADADMNLQVLQFDPENPKSMGGARLLHKSTFHTGHFPTTLHLLRSSVQLPNTSDFLGSSPGLMDIDSEPAQPLHQLLHTSQSGTIALITPLPESTYRRLSGLSTFLANTLESPCALNPRAYRAVENEMGGGGGTRGILDGNLLMRWCELGEQRRKEGLAKVGGSEWVLAAEREVLSGAGVFGKKL